MQTPNERLDLLKWIATNKNKVARLLASVEGLADHIANQPALHDVELFVAMSKLNNLYDRMDYLDKEIDSPHFINEGALKAKTK